VVPSDPLMQDERVRRSPDSISSADEDLRGFARAHLERVQPLKLHAAVYALEHEVRRVKLRP
jgi:hypothetical protein